MIYELSDIANIDVDSIQVWYRPSKGSPMEELTDFSPVLGDNNLYITNADGTPLFKAVQVLVTFSGSGATADIAPGLSIGGCFEEIGKWPKKKSKCQC